MINQVNVNPKFNNNQQLHYQNPGHAHKTQAAPFSRESKSPELP